MAKRIWTPDKPLWESEPSRQLVPKPSDPWLPTRQRDVSGERGFNNWSCTCCDPFVPGDPCLGCIAASDLFEITVTVGLDSDCSRNGGTTVMTVDQACRWVGFVPQVPFGDMRIFFEFQECPEIDNRATCWEPGHCQSAFDVNKLGVPSDICADDFNITLSDERHCFGGAGGGGSCDLDPPPNITGRCSATARVVGVYL